MTATKIGREPHYSRADADLLVRYAEAQASRWREGAASIRRNHPEFYPPAPGDRPGVREIDLPAVGFTPRERCRLAVLLGIPLAQLE